MCGTTADNHELPVVQVESFCACCSSEGSADKAAGDGDRNLVQATYAVTGMTCGHCATAVTRELQDVEGVSAVQVDLVAGGVSSVWVASTETLSQEQVRAALAEAGDYELTVAS
ncbi:heavy-metal-associated domain-containing protein [Ornithinimicrobium sp. Y1694]|uniref:heavy-metal-associated domain-containing protein n=1 Tax=Ornithinimicrobium sp. Y1694 TaxID=3418590 RepID=UPI003CF29199